LATHPLLNVNLSLFDTIYLAAFAEVLAAFPKINAMVEAVFANEAVATLRGSGMWPYFKRTDDE